MPSHLGPARGRLDRPWLHQGRRHSPQKCLARGEIHADAAALKEWAATVAALGSGDQTILFRKGGIYDAAFQLHEGFFFLFPNSFHSSGALLKPEAAARFSKELAFHPKQQQHVQIDFKACITGAWATHSPNMLEALTAFHVLGPDFLDRRLKWKRQQPMNILELRVHRLRQPLLLPQDERFYGCFSWVDIPAQQAEADPVLPDDAFADRQAALRFALEQITAQACT